MARMLIFLVCLGLSAASPSADEQWLAEGPISTVPEQPIRALPIASATAIQSASSVVGLRILHERTPTPVRYEDDSPFGPSGEGVGWLVRAVADITLRGRSEQLLMNIIVDGSSGGVIAGYTDPTDSWAIPMEAPRNPEITTEQDGWVMGEKAPDEMASTAADVVAEACRKFGIDFKEVGQVIVRPRWISAQYPAQKVGNSFIPLRKTEKVWIVQICGGKFNTSQVNGREEYQTTKVMQFRDGSLEYMGGVFTP